MSAVISQHGMPWAWYSTYIFSIAEEVPGQKRTNSKQVKYSIYEI